MGRKDKKKDKSRKPGNTAFRQQRLKAWQPILTPKTVLPLFFLVGLIFAPIGGLLVWSSTKVQELVIDYTDCSKEATGENFKRIPAGLYSAIFKDPLNANSGPEWRSFTESPTTDPRILKTNKNYTDKTVCTIKFDLPNDVQAPVMFYYRLTNFYQNHRRYVKSLDEAQLMGNPRTLGDLRGARDCDPLAGNGTLPYYPCGLIANSLFNDTFLSPVLLNPKAGPGIGPNKTYPMTNKNIAWASDSQRFRPSKYQASEILPPPNWADRYEGGVYTQDSIPNLQEDEEFQVWMRTAGLPMFSKLAMRNDNMTMEKGTYQVKIYSRFPVKEYGGTKSFVISTKTVMGGRNPFLGVAYLVVGGLCMVFGLVFTITNLVKPRKLGDHTYLSWNNDEPASTAHTSGRDNM
ncbi:CDC50/LEM3 family [Pyronema domesticum]|uniref:Similar to Meiotically up-regulated gene 89 protein acc. no. Q1MTQ5 n=1 Tax=Pyronema omphalodes (strain CBS 100304) TaxID=1076935 RepID=U4L9G0_PYROM|nr:CDC50/LEM3 family [Pyronema domesticum]CCX13716.1 Similar to Meiotically up-regulated gene 89 protein; acc. no. Q1MTQ5 [Pyronema omphalodes CBS 100304]